MQFSVATCYCLSLWMKYIPQQPVTKHPQIKFLPQNWRSVYSNIDNFLMTDGKPSP